MTSSRWDKKGNPETFLMRTWNSKGRACFREEKNPEFDEDNIEECYK